MTKQIDIRKVHVAKVSEELKTLQRQRTIVLKSRNMQANRIQAIVAGTIGYDPSLGEKERRKVFAEAAKLIKGINDGKDVKHPLKPIIETTLLGINAFDELKAGFEKAMIKEVKKLPVFNWTREPAQRGFGSLFLAITIGETGDLYLYDNYAEDDPRWLPRHGKDRMGGVYKLWKRLGCSPWTFNPTGEPGGEKTLMGATWRGGKEGKLPAEEWANFGYSPRRRSIAYLIGESMVKLNFLKANDVAEPINEYPAGETGFGPAPLDLNAGENNIGEVSDAGDDTGGETATAGVSGDAVKLPAGPYRAMYLTSKAEVHKTHPEWDWKECGKADVKKTPCEGKKCPRCAGCGFRCLRAHRHGMLLATKLLLRNLWVAWREC